MKITIEISDAEVEGIKDYITEIDGNEKPTKSDIQQVLQGEVSALLQASGTALFDHIQKHL